VLGMFGFSGILPSNTADAKTAPAAQKTIKKPAIKKTLKKPAAKKKAVVKKAIARKKGIGNGQCVHYVRYVTGLKFRGNAITWKKFINSKIPVIGSVVVLNYGKLGHVAVVKAVNGNKITIGEQNYYGPHIINTRTISKNDPKIMGYVAKLA
jgi:surface antigen